MPHTNTANARRSARHGRKKSQQHRPRNHDRVTQRKARKVVEIIKKTGPAQLATLPNLYKKCRDAVQAMKTLRPRLNSMSKEPVYYTSLRDQHIAHLLGKATLDDALAVLTEETPGGDWSWHVVLDVGLFGSRRTYASRAEAEEGAVAALSLIGRSATAGPNYEPELDESKKVEIHVGGSVYFVPRLAHDQRFLDALEEAVRAEGTTYDGLLARLANLLLMDGVENHPVALMMLANCGWKVVSQEVLEDFCHANGVVDLCDYSWDADDAGSQALH
jgi:hypothetical protein